MGHAGSKTFKRKKYRTGKREKGDRGEVKRYDLGKRRPPRREFRSLVEAPS